MSEREDQKKLDSLRREILQLQKRLNEINNIKESWFSKKEQSRQEVSKLREIIKEAKQKRDVLTQEVRDAKEKRRNLNDQTRKEISHIKTLNNEKASFLKRHGINKEPSKIKTEIERLEYKIETEALSFNKEQEIMKVIHNLKKQLDESKSVIEMLSQAQKLSGSIDVMRKEADVLHKQIQEKARESQESHELMIKSLKEFDAFKKKEKEAFRKFNESREEFGKLNEQLKLKLDEINKISGEVEIVREHFRERRREADKKTLEGKRREVEEKMKRGDKLTNEDLLALQGADDEQPL